LDVVSVPPNRPLARKDLNDLIYKSFKAKVDAVVKDVAERSKNGQPVLLGTTSIAKNEIFSAALSQAAVKHEVLNAKNNEREGAIIAQAGRSGAVTVATNVAGRGVDILLGGNPPSAEEAEKVRAAGGLHVVGTERHEARRIDNQLRGRAGRQGDPGSTQFFLSLEDDLMRIFGGERMKGLMERFDVPDDQPIEFKMVTNAVAQAQEKVEGANFDLRKHLLDYDDVLNKQRAAVYRRRNELLAMLSKEDVAKAIADAAFEYLPLALQQVAMAGSESQDSELTFAAKAAALFKGAALIKDENELPADPENAESYNELTLKRSTEVAENPIARNQLLSILDMLWMTNLEDLEALQESVGLRAYGQRDPLVEYRHEASSLFKAFWGNYNNWVFMNIFKLAGMSSGSETSGVYKTIPSVQATAPAGSENIGRNDPCPCGSGRKWKQCGLQNTEEHRRNMAEGDIKPKHEVTGG
jgi:preprotein translocase subunit SecA